MSSSGRLRSIPTAPTPQPPPLKGRGILTPLLADIIGLIGTALFIAAFAYANAAESLNKLWFNAANLVGAMLLLISLSVKFNLAAFVLEACWAVIASWGLVKAWREKRAVQQGASDA